MYKANFKVTLSLCIILTAGIAIGKYHHPTLIYFNTGLLLVILLTALLNKDFYTILFGFAVALIILFARFQKKHKSEYHILNEELLDASIALVAVLVVLYIKKLYRSIEAEKTQMNALFEFANEGIVVANSEKNIVLINPAAQKLFMYKAIELLGKKIDTLIPEKSQSVFEEYMANYRRNPSDITVGDGIDLFAVTKSGRQFQVEVSLSSYQQEKDIFTLAFISDVTQRRQAEKQLVSQKKQLQKVAWDMQKMNKELENKVAERTLILQEALQELEKSQLDLNEALKKEKELNEIKSRFVSMASHEFRTPLSTVLSSAALISKYKATDEQPKREKHLFRISNSVKHLNYMLEDFLSLGKLEEGRVSATVGGFNIDDFLKEVLDEMKPGLKPGQQLLLSFDGERYFVTDKRLLKNVLINLLSNAIKFSEENKPISVSALHRGARVIIQVKDKGMGIASEDMPHLFSTFFRGSNAVYIQGTGLGLHIIKSYINLLKGKITLSTQLHEGTTINIGLPDLSVD